MIKKSYLRIFLLSIILSLSLLIVERWLGIEWDYHPDSVSYATNSNQIVENIISGNLFGFLNNGYYFVAWLLGQNIELIILYNIVLFAFTNVMLAKLHWKLTRDCRQILGFSLLLLLLNPYRMHLSVTMLKDTTIIFSLVMILMRSTFSIAAYPIILSIRLASVLYLITFWLEKYSKVTLFLLLPNLFIFLWFTGVISIDSINTLVGMTSSTMQFRDFDTIPKFIEFGYWGVIIRMILWPFFALTGIFALISPVLPFIMVAIGCLLSMIYNLKVNKRIFPSWSVVLIMAVIASIVSSYTTYIRYVYPLVIIYPFFIIFKRTS